MLSTVHDFAMRVPSHPVSTAHKVSLGRSLTWVDAMISVLGSHSQSAQLKQRYVRRGREWSHDKNLPWIFPVCLMGVTNHTDDYRG